MTPLNLQLARDAEWKMESIESPCLPEEISILTISGCFRAFAAGGLGEGGRGLGGIGSVGGICAGCLGGHILDVDVQLAAAGPFLLSEPLLPLVEHHLHIFCVHQVHVHSRDLMAAGISEKAPATQQDCIEHTDSSAVLGPDDRYTGDV